MSDRLSKEDRKGLKKPDAFVAWGRKKVEQLLVGHGQRVLILVAVAVATVFGAYGYTRWKAHLSEMAWEEFYNAYKADEPARWEALSKMYTAHSGTRAGSYAAVLIADHHLQLAKTKVEKDLEASVAATADKAGKKKDPLFEVNLTTLPTEKENSTKAAEWYVKSKSFSGLLPEERQLIEINIANSQEIAGDLKAAEASYQAAAALNPMSKGLAMLNVGRVAEMQGQKDRAIKVYEEIAKEFSGNEKNREYERLAQSALRRVQSRLLTDGK